MQWYVLHRIKISIKNILQNLRWVLEIQNLVQNLNECGFLKIIYARHLNLILTF